MAPLLLLPLLLFLSSVVSVTHAHQPLHPRQATTSNATSARTSFGLKDDGATAVSASGIHVGFHIDWQHNETAQELNDKLGKPAAVFGSYIHLFLENITSAGAYAELDLVKPSILPLAGVSIYSPAVLPQFGIGNWTDAMSQQLANELKVLNDAGVTVWLRFAYEMNGYWMDFGLEPAAYIAAWQGLSTILKATTTDVYMLWAPNIVGTDIGPDSSTGYNTFYPGAAYVDLAGLSFYYLGENQENNTPVPAAYFSSNFQSFYDLYSPSHTIVIAETSCPEHYQVPDSLSYLGQDAELPDGANGVDFTNLTETSGSEGETEAQRKGEWFDQLAGNATAESYPQLAAVLWFNLAKVGGQLGGTLTLNDFRAVQGPTDNTTVYFRSLIGNEVAFDSHSVLPGDVGSTSSTLAPSTTAAPVTGTSSPLSKASSAAAQAGVTSTTTGGGGRVGFSWAAVVGLGVAGALVMG